MAKQTQLELIRELAQSREQELAAEVGELRRLQTDAETAFNRLQGYLSDYTADDGPCGAPMQRSISQIENERRFIQRLQQAVDQQHLHVRKFTDQVDQKVRSWHRERAHLESLDRVVGQRRVTAERIVARREQSETDAITERNLVLKKTQGMRTGNSP